MGVALVGGRWHRWASVGWLLPTSASLPVGRASSTVSAVAATAKAAGELLLSARKIGVATMRTSAPRTGASTVRVRTPVEGCSSHMYTIEEL